VAESERTRPRDDSGVVVPRPRQARPCIAKPAAGGHTACAVAGPRAGRRRRHPGRTPLNLVSYFITLSAFAVSANAVAPLISTLAGSLGVPPSRFGWLLTLQYAVFALTSFGGGALKEKLRLTNAHMVSAGLLVISAAFFAATVALRSPLALFVWVIPLGIAGSAVETFSSIQIFSLSRPGSSKAISLSQGFYSLGAFAAPQLVYVILGAGLSWKPAFLIIGVFSTLVFAFFLAYHLRRGSFASVGPAPAPPREAVRTRGGVFAAILLLMLAETLLESLSSSWTSYVFEVRDGLTARDASLALVLFWVGMAAGRFAVVALPVRWTMRPVMAVSAAGVLAASACLAVVPGLPVRLALVCLLGFLLGPLWPVIMVTASSTFRSDALTSAVIGMGAAGYALGPLLGSLMLRLGWVRQFFTAHLLLAVVIAVLCPATWLLSRRREATSR
jgi:fucose permease